MATSHTDPPQGDTLDHPAEDMGRLTFVVLGYGVALGSTSIAFPLLALEAGLSPIAVGLLATVSAVLQMGGKITLPALLTRFSDRSIIALALGVMLAAASVLLIAATAIWFVAAQVLQGTSRGLFWTASQTHGIRTKGVPTRQIAFIQGMGQVGTMVGPFLAGLLAARSLFTSLWAAVGISAACLALSLTLHKLPTYQRAPRKARTPIWRRKGVGPGNWGGAIAGAWRGVLESFVPVILSAAGYGAAIVGALMSMAELCGLIATGAVAKWGGRNVGRFIPYTALALAAGLVILAAWSQIWLIVFALALAGTGGGVGGVLGSASINEAVEHSEQGAAIALVGLYRAAARSTAPSLVSGALAVATLPAGLAVLAIGVTFPILWMRPRRIGSVTAEP